MAVGVQRPELRPARDYFEIESILVRIAAYSHFAEVRAAWLARSLIDESESAGRWRRLRGGGAR